MTPIKDEVHAIVDAQAAKGLAKYKRLLDGTPTSRSSLRDMAEEAVDLAHYALDADRQISALLEYVARLEGAVGQLIDLIQRQLKFEPQFYEVKDILATSPLSGQPQPAPASPWRPIAEAPDNWLYVGVWQSGKWFERSTNKQRAIAEGYTHYHPISAPPQEGE